MPSMSSGEEAWHQVTKQFQLFGDQIKRVYEERSGATEEGKEKFKEAMDTVTGALDSSVSAIGSTFADAEVKEQASSAAQALVGALSETFTEAAAGLRRAWGSVAGPAAGTSELADADADSSATREEPETAADAAAAPHVDPASDTDPDADSSATREP
jgi:thioredoxin-like negative regulator of GroEL